MTHPVQTEWIHIAPGFAGYLARPHAGRGPGLVLFPEIFGVNEHIRSVVEQYALAGFVVLAPDVFWRDAPRVELGYEGDDWNRAISLMKAYKTEDALSDIATTVRALCARPEVGSHPVGAIGYCMGGRLAYQAAATTDIRAAVSYYGGGIHLQLERAAHINCPMQFHYASDDANIPLEAVEQVRQAFVGKAAQVHVYPNSHHGFNCWARGAYSAAPAALAHGRALQFLAEHLF